MLTASRHDLLLPQRRRQLAVLAVVAVVGLYAWPLLDDATSASSHVDRLLRLAAVTAVGLACLSASWRHDGRERTALLVVAAGSQVWACVQAAHLIRDLLGRSGQLPGLDAVGVLVLTASAAAGLWLLRSPQGRGPALRVATEWALVTVSGVVLVRLAAPSFWTSGETLADWARAAGISLLVAAGLLTSAHPRSTDRAWPLLPQALVVLAAALAVATSSVPAVPPRVPGLLLAACLVVVAVAVALGGDPRDPARPREAGGPPAAVVGILCLLTLAAVGAVMLDLLASGRVHPTGLGGLVVLGLLAAAHGHLLSMQARSEVRQMVELEQSMRHRAFHDDLTGLANRALFLDRLTHALDLHRRHRLPVSVLYCDLDGFKHVNDRHGHLVGDALLAALATRLRQCLRPEDTLARLGGDEFGLLLEHASSSDVVADRLREALIEPFTVAGLTLRLGMSIGSTRVEPHDPTPSPQEVLERADADMYVAKSTRVPRAAPAPCSPEPDLAAALARGLHSGEVSVVYQPLVDAATGAVHGTEALARWRHDGRVLLPEVFVELAERVGLSDALTDVVLEQSCAQLSTWSAAAGHRRLTMSVNVSPSQIVDPTLPARVRAVVDRHGLDHEQVVLETTVAAVTAGSQTGASTGVGLRLSLGGFTGAPDEFALLSALPVRSVKVAGAHAADDERLLHVLVALGRELDVAVVVERVERPDELAVLRTLTGVLAQGYLLSKPSEAAALDEIVLRGCPLPV